ncbi:MAG TPA: rRNA maturation RNase YbeY [Blastocatellia bacterium]|nr:rRNA maturation RNase YbeY [Blastocatellia bacterium]
MAIDVVNQQRLARINRKHIGDLAKATLAAVAHSGEASATIAFVRDRRMRELNAAYRGKDRTTDVLSFPAGPGPAEPHYLGDVVISTDTALRQAEQAGHSFEREVSELVIHGVLHLCGYDHETDNGEMNRLERRLRRRLLD